MLKVITITRLALGSTMLLLTSALIACSSAVTTTPSPAAGTPIVQATQPISAQPTAPVSQPTVSLPSTTNTPIAAGTTPTATKFAVAVASPTNTSAPKGPAPTVVPPKPAAPTGKIAYTLVTGDAPKYHSVWLAGPDGSGQHQVLTNAQWPVLSPEGSRIAYLGNPEGGSKGLYLANADGGNPVLIVNDAGVCCINWSHDGNWIVYADSPRPNFPGGDISKIKIDSAYKTTAPLGVTGNGPSFSPDDKQVVYSGSLPNQGSLGLMIVSAEGGAPRQITTDNGGNAQWSPRGDKLVYAASDGAGHRQIYSINPDGSGKKQLTNGKSNEGQPIWSRDGNSIFWRSDQNGTVWGIFVMNADGSNQRRIINDVAPDPTFWGWESLSVSQ